MPRLFSHRYASKYFQLLFEVLWAILNNNPYLKHTIYFMLPQTVPFPGVSAHVHRAFWDGLRHFGNGCYLVQVGEYVETRFCPNSCTIWFSGDEENAVTHTKPISQKSRLSDNHQLTQIFVNLFWKVSVSTYPTECWRDRVLTFELSSLGLIPVLTINCFIVCCPWCRSESGYPIRWHYFVELKIARCPSQRIGTFADTLAIY